jgi:hypothetical protein
MKVAAILSLFAVGVNGFTTSTTQRASVSLQATAELEGLVGVDIESGKKIVRACRERIHCAVYLAISIYFTNSSLMEVLVISCSHVYSSTPLDLLNGDR